MRPHLRCRCCEGGVAAAAQRQRSELASARLSGLRSSERSEAKRFGVHPYT
ncbi:MAG: hypothetical protein IKJ94_04535 [Oscillospiraceae bacterium]|nr:hypothetical protein [Oscillospiraceae bacterium]